MTIDNTVNLHSIKIDKLHQAQAATLKSHGLDIN